VPRRVSAITRPRPTTTSGRRFPSQFAHQVAGHQEPRGPAPPRRRSLHPDDALGSSRERSSKISTGGSAQQRARRCSPASSGSTPWPVAARGLPGLPAAITSSTRVLEALGLGDPHSVLRALAPAAAALRPAATRRESAGAAAAVRRPPMWREPASGASGPLRRAWWSTCRAGAHHLKKTTPSGSGKPCRPAEPELTATPFCSCACRREPCCIRVAGCPSARDDQSPTYDSFIRRGSRAAAAGPVPD